MEKDPDRRFVTATEFGRALLYAVREGDRKAEACTEAEDLGPEAVGQQTEIELGDETWPSSKQENRRLGVPSSLPRQEIPPSIPSAADPAEYTPMFGQGSPPSRPVKSDPPAGFEASSIPPLPPPSPPATLAPAPDSPPPRPSYLASKLGEITRWLTGGFAFKRRKGLDGWTSTPHLPDHARVDNVHFSITAPGSVTPGWQFELQFWAHLEADRETVHARAVEALGLSARKKMLFASQGPYTITRGAVLGVRLTVDQMEIVEDSKVILWTGDIGVAAFVLKVNPGATLAPHAGKASICVDGVAVARLEFVLHVQKSRSRPKTVPSELKPHRRAFASYASEDRSQVLARVQGINKVAPDLAVFVDVLSLRSGEYWAQRLAEEIPTHDTFYLFWSRHASASPWVEKEWRCAYEKKGLDFIDPIPLEPPSKAPPPTELAAKHFNDPLLALLMLGASD
jgi:hypothetical protein